MGKGEREGEGEREGGRGGEERGRGQGRRTSSRIGDSGKLIGRLGTRIGDSVRLIGNGEEHEADAWGRGREGKGGELAHRRKWKVN